MPCLHAVARAPRMLGKRAGPAVGTKIACAAHPVKRAASARALPDQPVAVAGPPPSLGR
jgi:hypothetical protein